MMNITIINDKFKNTRIIRFEREERERRKGNEREI